jgi:hypothetical protein
MAKKKVEEVENEELDYSDLVDDETEGVDAGRIPAVLQFFKQFENEEIYTISVYKAGDRKKGEKQNKAYLFELKDELPDLDMLRDNYGGGKYLFYVHVPGKGLVQTPSVNIAEPLKKDVGQNTNITPSKVEVINELKDMASLVQSLGGHGNNNDNSKMMFEMMMQMNNNTNKMFEKMADNQRETERRTIELIQATSKPQTGLSDTLSLIKMVNEVKGELGGDSGGSSTMETILSMASPLISGIAGKLAGDVGSSKPAASQPIEYKTDLFETANKLPDAFKNTVTIENAEETAQYIYSKNSSVLNISECREIVKIILAQKPEKPVIELTEQEEK